MPLIRSISGLRATLGDSLLPQIIAKYATAFSLFLPNGKVIVGRDGRPSGEWIEQIVIAAILATGREVESIGIVPTPTVQLCVEHSDAAGGIAITASHNPGQWNGLKFLNSDGVFLDANENSTFWEILDADDYQLSDKQSFPKAIYNANSLESHIEQILNLPIFKNSDLIQKIKSKKIVAVVDAVNASGSLVVPQLLEKLGVKCISLYCDGSGIFPHTPEPLAENLTDLARAVKKHNADIGIAVDPDADRLVLVDNEGNNISEEKTIVLSALSLLQNLAFFKSNQELAFAVNHSTSRMIDDIASEFDVRVYRSAVGEINVVKKMKEVNAIFGGEGSGGVILPSCHYGRDSLVGIALVMALLAKSDKKLNELSSSLPLYSMLKFKKDFSGNIDSIIAKVKSEFKDAEFIEEDGFKVLLDKAWVQIRKSNTEPIIRVIAEAKSEKEANSLAQRVLSYCE